MISKAAQWHVTRQEEIIKKYPQVLSIKKYNPYCLITIVLIPIAQFTLAYFSQYLSIIMIFALAWIGGLIILAMFNNSHELCHNVVSPKIKNGKLYKFLMHFASLPGINASIYLLFRWAHIPHHFVLGEQSVSEAYNLLEIESPDLELLFDQYIYEIRFTPNTPPRPYIDFVFRNHYLRIIFTFFIYPIIGTLKATLLSPIIFIIKYIKNLFVKNPKLHKERLNSALIHLFLVYVLLFFLYVLAGPLAILYLVFSELFSRGLLLHPGIVFALSTHKTWGTEENFQPTTSTYGKIASFLMTKINYHVEHHDFPNIPRQNLPQLKKIAPEYYESLNYFQGISGVFYHFFIGAHWLYAGNFGENTNLRLTKKESE